MSSKGSNVVGGAPMGATSPKKHAAVSPLKRLSTIGGIHHRPVTTHAIHDDSKKYELVNAKLSIKHAFGSNALPMDGLQSYIPINNDKESLGNLIYRVGKHICVINADTTMENFLMNRPKNITDVVHFTISSNQKFISICESLRDANNPDDKEIHTQVSIYSLKSFELVRTIVHECESDFVMSAFCGDNKYLVTLSGPQHTELAVWGWEKGRLIQTISLPNQQQLRLRGSTSSSLQFSTSGLNHLKGWHIGNDMTCKPISLFSGIKEMDNFVDHIWLSGDDFFHRLAVLVGFPCDPTTVTKAAEAQKMIKQSVHIFEGIATNNGSHSSSSNHDSSVTQMEFIQTVTVKVDGPKGIYATAITKTSKGFVLAGLGGMVVFYERSEDKKEGYVEFGRMNLGDVAINAAALLANDTFMVILLKDNKLLNMSLENVNKDIDTSKSTQLSSVATTVAAGFHDQTIISADVALSRPILVTISNDQTARIWNYESCKCELKHNFRTDEPLAVSIHPNGFSLLVSFKDRIRLYNILTDKLHIYKETILKNSKEIKFSNGGHLWAAASSINIVVYDTRTFQQIATLQGHTMTVRKIAWAIGDQLLFSAGMDGNVYGWSVSREGRLDIITSNSRSSSILGFLVDSNEKLFSKIHKDDDDDNDNDGVPNSAIDTNSSSSSSSSSSSADYLSKCVVLALQDGNMKIPEWSYDMKRGSNLDPKLLFGNDVPITTICLSSDKKLLYAGTSEGKVRLYAWPPRGDTADGVYIEYQVHNNSSVVTIRESCIGDSVISVAEDGSIFIFDLKKIKDDESSSSSMILDTDVPSYNDEVILMSIENFDEHVTSMINLRKTLVETNQKHSFHIMQKELEYAEDLKKFTSMNEISVLAERSKYEKRMAELDKTIKELQGSLDKNDIDYSKNKIEIENRYEHKLADQMERYDRLSEEMELLKQKCEALISSERDIMSKQLNDLKNEAKAREKKMRTEYRRVADDRTADESAFKEILDQQEDEYEDELRQLVTAAESELTNERDTIVKLRTLVQTKNTKMDQLKKKLLELSLASKARLALLTNERKEKQKLIEIIEHYKVNLKEREDALTEKESIILELRSSKRTLENFRFVLDHRLQQLASERGPIATHIEGLERHISTMYEELVEEFDYKRNTSTTLDLKNKKISILTQDLANARDDKAKREQYVANFKRELGNIITANTIGKDLEEAIRILYRKYVKGERGEDIGGVQIASGPIRDKMEELLYSADNDDASVGSIPNGGVKKNKSSSSSSGGGGGGGRMNSSMVQQVEEALIETAKEAERQKDFVKKEATSLQNRLQVTKNESMRISRNRLTENSNLLYECNDLRRNLKALERKYEGVAKDLEDATATIRNMEDFHHSQQQNRIESSNEVEVITDDDTFNDSNTSRAAAAAAYSSNMVDTTMTQKATDAQKYVPVKAGTSSTSWIVNNALGKSSSTGILLRKLSSNVTLGVSSSNPVLGNVDAVGNIHAPPVDEIVTKAGKTSSTSASRIIQRLSKENDTLVYQLNNTFREKEMHRLELDRMKNVMMKMTHEYKTGGTNKAKTYVEDSNFDASANANLAYRISYNSSNNNDFNNCNNSTGNSRGSGVDDVLAVNLAPIVHVIKSRPTSDSRKRGNTPLPAV